MNHTPDIIEFVQSDRYLGPTEISVPQLAILKAIYGIPLGAEELGAWREMGAVTPKPRAGGYSTAWIIAGVRSGKTDKILANIAVYETFIFDPEVLSPGEKAFFPLVAQNMDGASRAREYIEGKLLRLEERGWDILDHGTAQSRSITGKEIRTTKGVTIRCFPCTKAAVRGLTAIGYGTDEVAWWQTEEGGYNADREVIRALRSRVATIGKTAKRINVSSPYAEEGILWEAWERRFNSHELVLNTASWVLNPSLDADFLRQEQQDDPVAYLREYGAQFGKDGGGYFSPDEVDRVIDKSRPLILPHAMGTEYFGAIDVGFKHDLYVVGIAHMDREGGVTVDLIQTWQGSKKQPLNGVEVAREASRILKSYGIQSVTGDQYWDLQVQKDYAENEITVIIENESAGSGFEKFNNLKSIIRRGLLCLPDDPIIRKDLLSLRRMKGNPPKIAAPERRGFHDDVSNVLGKLAMKILPLSQSVDTVEVNRSGMPYSGEFPELRRIRQDSEFSGVDRDIMSEVY